MIVSCCYCKHCECYFDDLEFSEDLENREDNLNQFCLTYPQFGYIKNNEPHKIKFYKCICPDCSGTIKMGEVNYEA